jgi:uncharacterized membrane protein YbhN (UPF0104 family)
VKRALLALRIAAALGVLVLILARADVSEVRSTLASASPAWVLVAFATNVLAVFASTLLWREMAPAHTRPPYLSMVRRYFVGLFYNNVGLGTAIGDSVRAAGAWRDGMSGSQAAVSVVAERVLSMLALLALASAGAFYLLDAHAGVSVAVWATSAGCVALLIAASLGAGAFAAGVPMPRAFGNIAEGLADALAHLLRRRRALVRGGVLAIAVQLLTVAATAMLTRAVGAPLAPVEALALVPVVALLVLLPVSVQGIGVREAAYVWAFGLAGIAADAAVAAALLSYVTTLGCSLVGGALLLEPALARLRRGADGRPSSEPAPERRAA